MEWDTLLLSLRLAGLTALLLLPVGILAGRALARAGGRARALGEAAVMLPLLLPPTVLGFYLLQAFGGGAPLGRAWAALSGRPLVFTFEGILLASLVVNLPFAVQPALRAFEAIPRALVEAAESCGMTPLRAFLRVELPLAWRGIASGAALVAAHTLGEFGVVLMVGGAIPGETRTIAVAIYDRVQAFDDAAAGRMAALLMAVSLATLALTIWLAGRGERR